jgi:predicted unusual protein kinase regulating ubiquinone biosynthesis (AarF/ABC1/UbiB family)
MRRDGDEPDGQGKPVATGKFGRAFQIGKLASRVTGSTLVGALKRPFGGGREEHSAATAAVIRNAGEIARVMGQMKGAAMKIGQILGTDPDFLSSEFSQHLSLLHRNAPPMDFATVKAQVESALERPLEQAFASFEETPVGSASIGQVHRATLHDGRVAAVKVQYPGIVDSLESDLSLLGNVLQVARVFVSKDRLREFLGEVRTAMLEEADYTLEARNLARFRRILANERDLRLPEPYFELTAPAVLTMEFVPGEKLDDALTALEDPEARNRLVVRFVETFVRMFHERHVLHCDPHPGNFLLDPEGRIVLLDFGCVRDFKPETGDEVLRLLSSFWRDDIDASMECYRRMGFGTSDGTLPPAELVREYHQLILEPIREHGEFDFGAWQVHQRIRRFLREHMEMVKLVPPAELLLYLRVLAGLKGLLTRMNARIDLRTLAEAQCVRRGVIP